MSARLQNIGFIPATAPIGSVCAWLKSYTNTPALDVQWAECNGQVLADTRSVYNGQTLPNLNTSDGGTNGLILKGRSNSQAATDEHVTIINTTPTIYFVVWIMRIW